MSPLGTFRLMLCMIILCLFHKGAQSQEQTVNDTKMIESELVKLEQELEILEEQKDDQQYNSGDLSQEYEQELDEDDWDVYSPDYKLLSEEWEAEMSDFSPADLITLHIPARGSQNFYEDIQVIPSRVRGAWFITNPDNGHISVQIKDPVKNVIFERKEKVEGIFYFDARRRGEYSFNFENQNLLESIKITFALHCGNSSDELLMSQHLTPFEERLHDVEKNLKDLWVDFEFAEIRHESHFRTVADANRNVFLFSLLECGIIIAISSMQVYYIKRLLDNRIII